MKKIFFLPVVAALLLLNSSCNTTKQTAKKEKGKIDFTIVQINDVYEIAPLDGGKVGGVARVATVKKQELAKNPNTMLILAGDFLSPSVYNSLKFEGNRIRGKQMVDALNTAGLDLAVFGNHEFDIPEADLQSRIDESAFQWVSTNTYTTRKTYVVPFTKNSAAGSVLLPEIYIKNFENKNGKIAKIGFIGLTLPFNKASYVNYTDVFTAAQKYYDELKKYCDAVIAVTHQSMEDDIKLARQIPGLALIIGGHEHERHYAKIGKVYITKADANAKSVYIIKLNLNKRNKKLKVQADIMDVNEKTTLDSATNVVVKKWTDIANKSYASLGFDATKVCMQTGEPLDGREAYIRTQQTNFTKLIVSSMEKASPTADVCIINSGSIRVDDIVQMPVTQYDVIRSLPFGGSIMEVDMKGSLLIKILNAAKTNVGSGGFLQYSAALNNDNNGWALKNIPVDAGKVYKLAITDFLMTGGEANLDFLTKDNPGIVKVYPLFTDLNDSRSDVRRAIIRYMEGLGN
jgi:5'-nucleotidase